MGGVGGVLNWVELAILEELSGRCVISGSCARMWLIIFQTLSQVSQETNIDIVQS